MTEDDKADVYAAMTTLYAMKSAEQLSLMMKAIHSLGGDTEEQLTSLSAATQLVVMTWAKLIVDVSDITMEEALGVMHNLCCEFTTNKKIERLPRIQLYE